MRRIDKVFYKKIFLTFLIIAIGGYIFSIFFKNSDDMYLSSLTLMFSIFLAFIFILMIQIFRIYKDRTKLKSFVANKQNYKRYNIIDMIHNYKHPIINNKNGTIIENIIIDYKMHTSDYNLEPKIKKLRSEKNIKISDIESIHIDYNYPTLIKLSNNQWYAISKKIINKKDNSIYLINDTSFFLEDFYASNIHYIEIKKPQLFRNH